MGKILYYPAYWLVYAVSMLPLWLLYGVSGIIRVVLFGLFSYRKKVITENLTNAFPEKALTEIKKIRKEFQKHFCDFLMESLKLLSIRHKNIKRRFTFDESSAELIEKYFSQNKTVLVVLGHYGNWEYLGPGFRFWGNKPLMSAYRPLKSKLADRLVRRSRERFGTDMIPMKALTREMFRRKDDVCAVLLLADQSPSMERQSYWLKFFNQETPVFQGTEKIARKFGLPVLFASIRKVKRGYYKVYFDLVSDKPEDLAEGELTLKHTKMLENDIRRDPRYWLWSHKRWKHKDKRGNNPLLSS